MADLPLVISTRDIIMREARRLFARKGIDGVSTRDIMKAAGQKNTASLSYYFGSKEKLVREIILDGAKILNERRKRLLDDIEAAGGPASAREITDVLVFSAVEMHSADLEGVDDYTRFITHIGQHHPDLFIDTLGEAHASEFTRCFRHLRRFMPEMPSPVKTQRIQFIASYMGSILSARERALEARGDDYLIWSSEASLHHVSQSMCVIIEAPYEPEAFGHTDLSKIREENPHAALLGVRPLTLDAD